MTGRCNGMEIAGIHSASRQPDGVQATNADPKRIERCLTHIHAARAALDAAEDHLGKADPGRTDAYRLAAAISLSIAENNCVDASKTLAEISDRYKVPGAAYRSSYRPAQC